MLHRFTLGRAPVVFAWFVGLALASVLIAEMMAAPSARAQRRRLADGGVAPAGDGGVAARPRRRRVDAGVDAGVPEEPDAGLTGEEGMEGQGGQGEEVQLRPPTAEQPMVLPEEEEQGEEPTEGQQIVTPDDAAARLAAGAPDATGATDATRGNEWSAPQPVLTLHGYFRTRGEMQDTFYFGRTPVAGLTEDAPFSDYRPIESRPGVVPMGGCGDDPMTLEACDTEALSFANMRLRLMPELALSDDVRVKMWIDALDNVVLGSTPDGFYVVPQGGADPYQVGRSPYVPLQGFTTTLVPPQYGRNSIQDSIYVRRAWAEVRNRQLGELRFGRMGSHWGLGILANGGEGLDSDYSSDVDRVMGITKLAGLYLIAAYDFAAEGFIHQQMSDLTGPPWDAGQRDDVDQYVFAVARRSTPEEQEQTLERGAPVFNGGVYFVYRTQDLSSEFTPNPLSPGADVDASAALVRRAANAFIPDLWVQFLYKTLRLEIEAVMIAGDIENIGLDSYVNSNLGIFQLGAAFEGELRLFDEKLGIYFNTGFASGDADVEGLSSRQGLLTQEPVGGRIDNSIETFQFHPNYRVDLILWRNIMRRIAGAYYFRPGISYDFIRGAFGQLFGARLDFIWSRAASPVQTWGNEADLGVEINASVYYRSEDGPEILDGFYAMAQYGILFPLEGLGYLEGEMGPELENAQTLRAVLGVVF